MIRALKALARVVVFGPPKRVPKYVQYRTAKQRMTEQLKRELRADKLRAVEANLVAFRAVEEAICPSLAIQRKSG